MRSETRVLLVSGLCGGLLAMASSCLAAAPYPTQPIRLIVPFAPGGGADANARRVAEPWSKALGQSIVVENKPGAGGTLGASFVAQAPHDGYTLLYATPGQQMTAPYLFKNLAYDPFKSLVPVGKLSVGANVLVVTKSLPVHNVQELIDYARAHPGKLGFASSGVGSTSHLAGELFKQKAGVDIFHVPYRGTGPARTDLMSGQVPMTIDTLSVYLPLIQSGDVRALGVSTLKRDPAFPDLPAIAETLPGFEAVPVNYIAAPAGTPRAVIDKLNATLNQVIADPRVRNSFEKGTSLEGGSPQEMEQLITTEQAKWKALIERAGIKPE
ncbi:MULTISPECIES: tripartite tricarboxylate transporter substrate binding protein [unclassified Achromobacter]|uniref:Bug family tripartite tricarboxylate transporter substrate binding protein n=1 Tax=unclassified Achromobacter TaxID=2626865 RepID=UPI000B516B33|nr:MULTISPECIES: tripartite tricarboxylate transporter substrate binding protein [unclassified Achromobacter]OWT73585.1 ABC transporter substrate-binding protein [Achromobacter sp. HZ34]OWT79498.1 ABC transporter substrate-binding protein [Achromobacter sp. HZ28]